MIPASSVITPRQDNEDVPAWSAAGWTEVTLIKHSTGDVVFGFRPNLFPLSSGNGIQIPSSAPTTIRVPGGTRIYFAASGPSEKVAVITTRMPFLDMLEDFLLLQNAKINPKVLEQVRAAFSKE